MQNFNEEGEDLFFDSYDYIRTSVDSTSSEEIVAEKPHRELRRFDYEFWASEPISVHERRDRFLRSMGFDEFVFSQFGCDQETKQLMCNGPEENSDLGRMRESSGATLDPLSSPDNGGHRDSFCCIRDLDSGKKFIVQDLGQDGLSSMLKEVGSDRVMTLQEFETFLGLSRSVQRFMRREMVLPREKHDGSHDTRKKKSRSWWRNFTTRRNAVGICRQDATVKSSKLPRTVRTKVQQHGKRCMEFTALYKGQEIQAHKGLIRIMRFSPSGRYLASGGEDCVIRIWKIREVEASCKCLTASGSSKFVDEVKDGKLIPRRKVSSSAPVIIPKKAFMIEETPLHEYHGHTSDVLDLSWSKSNFLLSSSKDRTVRLWKVGCKGCLKVFQHNDYVTCIQFNPLDERYFISGSIDGKVRIWGVQENRVVDWADIRDIVTTVCYQPDGKGFVVGSITGNCRFYDYSGNTMQLETQLCVQGKKSAGKPITGLEFSPEDSEKVMVTSADSRVRIYDGFDVIHKFRGLRKSKSQLSASFTSDGRYIISVGEDSHVYIWNYNEAGIPSPKGVKSTRSCECFFSEGLSAAVPWPGLKHREPGSSNNNAHASSPPRKVLEPSTWLRDPDCFSLGVWFFSDCSSRVSATWPEEKLPPSPEQAEPATHVDNNYHHHEDDLNHHFQYLTSLAATWSLVIVTASQDGCIRSFHNYGLPVRL